VFGFGYGALPAFYTENFLTRYRASGAKVIAGARASGISVTSQLSIAAPFFATFSMFINIVRLRRY
jgi:hypothetical protein